jgi:general secretion pathway protein B
MSYILDALRRAEAERERGTVPSIHAQPAFAGARPADAPARSRLWIGVTLIGVLLALVVAILLYLLLGRGGPVNEGVAPVATPPTTAAATPVPAVPAAPAPAVAVAPPVQTAPPPVRKARPVPAPATPASSAASSPAMPATPTKTEERVYTVNELPDDIRRQLPALSVGGSMYSPVAANRLVIINGQVLHEGEHITPELVVQQIKLKAAVLAFKSYRFAITF